MQRRLATGLVIVTTLLLTAACGRASPGDEVHYDRSVNFYMALDAGSFVEVRESDHARILAGAVWELDDGLEMVESDLSLSPADVSWSESRGQEVVRYTAQGAKLTMDVRVRVAEDAEPGWAGIRLQLPGLQRFGEATRSMATFPSQPGFENTHVGFSEGFIVAGVTILEDS